MFGRFQEAAIMSAQYSSCLHDIGFSIYDLINISNIFLDKAYDLIDNTIA